MLRRHLLTELEAKIESYISRLSRGALRLRLYHEGDAVKHAVSVRGSGGQTRERDLRLFAAGEWRRISLGFSLAYAEFVKERLGLSCNLLVLDEAFHHLDAEGAKATIETLRSLKQDTVIVIEHNTSEAMRKSFDCVDMVSKLDGKSRAPDGGTSSEPPSAAARIAVKPQGNATLAVHTSPDERLATLEKSKRYLTEAEYLEKRASILAEL